MDARIGKDLSPKAILFFRVLNDETLNPTYTHSSCWLKERRWEIQIKRLSVDMIAVY